MYEPSAKSVSHFHPCTGMRTMILHKRMHIAFIEYRYNHAMEEKPDDIPKEKKRITKGFVASRLKYPKDDENKE